MREKIVQWVYRRFPFDLTGDCRVPPATDGVRISCIINFYGRMDLLSGILFSLAQQQFPHDRFEVLLVEDRGGTPEGRRCAEQFADILPVRYLPLDKNFGKMGYSRNFGVARSRGEYILFLDDDTIILQNNFHAILENIGTAHADTDAFIPHGAASFALIDGKYDHHDEYFMTSRCMAYRRTALAELGGFIDDFVGQEDVEFVMRYHMSGRRSTRCPDLEYRHPPLLVPNFRKPRAVGASFYRLRQRYPTVIWLLMLANCARHAPLLLLPVRRFQEQGRFGVGFLGGILDGIRGSSDQVYG